MVNSFWNSVIATVIGAVIAYWIIETLKAKGYSYRGPAEGNQ